MSICEVSFFGFAKIVKDLSYRHKYLLCFVGRDDWIAEFDHMDPDQPSGLFLVLIFGPGRGGFDEVFEVLVRG